jgi:hypothetical protein
METASPCYLITLHKKGFDDLVGTYHKQQNLNTIKYLKQYSFFAEVPHFKFLPFLPFLLQRDVKRGTVLYQEGDKCDGIFFLREGDVEISSVVRTMDTTTAAEIRNNNEKS